MSAEIHFTQRIGVAMGCRQVLGREADARSDRCTQQPQWHWFPEWGGSCDPICYFSLLTSSSCILHPVPVQAVQVMRLWLAGGGCKGRLLGSFDMVHTRSDWLCPDPGEWRAQASCSRPNTYVENISGLQNSLLIICLYLSKRSAFLWRGRVSQKS